MSLKEKIKNCKRCPLYKNMPDGCSPVPGIGPQNAQIMFVGEALGEDESIYGEPFVGRCGRFMNVQMLSPAGIKREDLYITNTVKCRPTKGNANRPPSDVEITKCKGWLWEEIKLVKPKVIVTLGKIPTYTLLNKELKKSFTLKSVIGKSFDMDFNGIKTKVYPLYHPSYLMVRNRKAIDDNVKVLKGLL